MNERTDYPNDADGDALRRVAADGSDMTKPMSVDFHVSVPSRQNAEAVVSAAGQLGFATRIWDYEEGDEDWTAECTKTMIATYKAVVETQRSLTELAGPHGGSCNEWGTLGNV